MANNLAFSFYKGFHNCLKLQHVSWLVEIIELTKGVIIWLHKKGGEIERHSLIYKKCLAKCWSISKYLLLLNSIVFKEISGYMDKLITLKSYNKGPA